jgi:hypothetical protein
MMKRATAILAIIQGFATAQIRTPATAGVPVQMVVTVEARRGSEVPVLRREEVLVFQSTGQSNGAQENDRRPVTAWVPCQGDKANLELFILIDDASATSLGSQYEDIRDFIRTQPPTTSIAIGYMRNGMVDVVQPLTADRTQAVQKLRLPMDSSTSGNPFQSVSALIKTWPTGAPRREILMVTPGFTVLELGGEGFRNIFVDAAIADAQRAGVIVHAIFALGAGHSGHRLWSSLWARTYLAQIAEQTGGEAYSLDFGAPVSLAPYLSEFTERLAHQYLLTFSARPSEKSAFHPVRLASEIPNADLVAADRVWVAKP